MLRWCICWASIGKCSQICTSPLVLIGLNGPPVAAPGFRSHRSIVDGPPPIQSMMADLPRCLQGLGIGAQGAGRTCSAGAASAEAPARWDRK